MATTISPILNSLHFDMDCLYALDCLHFKCIHDVHVLHIFCQAVSIVSVHSNVTPHLESITMVSWYCKIAEQGGVKISLLLITLPMFGITLVCLIVRLIKIVYTVCLRLQVGSDFNAYFTGRTLYQNLCIIWMDAKEIHWQAQTIMRSTWAHCQLEIVQTVNILIVCVLANNGLLQTKSHLDQNYLWDGPGPLDDRNQN